MNITVQQYASGKWNAYTSQKHIDDTFTTYEELFDHIDNIDLPGFRLRAQAAIIKSRTTQLRP